jgi:phosphomannomutase/phosphoglucomutase
MKADIKSLKSGSALPIVAAVCVLLALWFAGTGWQVWSANSLLKSVDEARGKLAGQVGPMISSLNSKAASLSGRADLATAMRAGNNDAARAIVMQAVPGTEAVDIAPPGFAQAYSDPAAFGYGKLGLIEKASAEGRPAIAVIKDGGGPRLGVAVSIVEGAQVLGVVYLREPLTELCKLA